MDEEKTTLSELEKRFSNKKIKILRENNIDANKALYYKKRFGAKDIIILMGAGISPEQAELYERRFNGQDITNLVRNKISPQTAAAYKGQFNGRDIINLISKHIPPDIANSYYQRFKPEEIITLQGLMIGPAIANKYQRLSLEEIVYWEKGNVITRQESPKKAGRKEYMAHQNIPKDLKRAKKSFKKGLDSKAYMQYKGFRSEEIARLKKMGVGWEYAVSLKKRFDTASIIQLKRYGVSLERINRYPSHLNAQDIITLSKKGIQPHEARGYSSEFSGRDIAEFKKARIGREQVEKYSSKDSGGIIRLVNANIQPEIANNYSSRFDAKGIVYLTKRGMGLEFAEKYDKRFSAENIANLIQEGIGPDRANEFPKIHGVLEILLSSTLGITPDSIRSNELIGNIIRGLITHQGTISETNDSKYIGMGQNSIVLFINSNKEAYKCSRNLDNEKRIFSRLRNSSGTTKFVINMLDKVIKRPSLDIIALDYVNGTTLQDKIYEEGPLEYTSILKYGYHIVCGIEELRRADVYHRDLHDRNIMINSEDDKALIIDLGSATDNPEKIYSQNRAYGGNNDLISLGLLLYSMRFKGNLFNDSDSTTVSYVKDKIKSNRELAYESPEILNNNLSKLIDKVPSEETGLAEIMVNLLDRDLWQQPDLEQVCNVKLLFEKYLTDPDTN
jgi:hypothetical protein